jgi:hypothetical protein
VSMLLPEKSMVAGYDNTMMKATLKEIFCYL